MCFGNVIYYDREGLSSFPDLVQIRDLEIRDCSKSVINDIIIFLFSVLLGQQEDWNKPWSGVKEMLEEILCLIVGLELGEVGYIKEFPPYHKLRT